MLRTELYPFIGSTEAKQGIQSFNTKAETQGYEVKVSPTKTYVLRHRDGMPNQYELVSNDQFTLEDKDIRIFKQQDIEVFYTDIKQLLEKLEASKKELNAENTKLLSADIHNNILNDIDDFSKKHSIELITNRSAIKYNEHNKDEFTIALENVINNLEGLCEQYKANSLKSKNKFIKFLSSIKSVLSEFFTTIQTIFFNENYRLFRAIAKNDINKIEELLSNVDINNVRQGRKKLTPLMYAVKKGNLKVIDLLLKNNADLDAKDKRGNTALIHATLNQRLDIIQKLVDSGANIDEQNNMGNTALMITVFRDSIETANELITLNANINLTNNRSDSALMLAIYRNKLNFVKELTEKDADINIKNIKGEDAFVCALNKKKIDPYILDYLVTKDNCNIQNKYGATIAMIFAKNNFSNCGRLLNTLKADVNIKDNEGKTVLMHAAITGNRLLLKELLNHQNTDINMGDNIGKTALMYAAEKYNANILQELLNHQNTKVDKKDKYGRDALKYAIREVNLQSVRQLLKAGANPYSVTNEGRNAYEIAYSEKRSIEYSNSLDYWGSFDLDIYDIIDALRQVS
jgi:ankyrin repeat protein